MKINKIQEKINRLKENKIKYDLLSKKLEETGEPQICYLDDNGKHMLIMWQDYK